MVELELIQDGFEDGELCYWNYSPPQEATDISDLIKNSAWFTVLKEYDEDREEFETYNVYVSKTINYLTENKKRLTKKNIKWYVEHSNIGDGSFDAIDDWDEACYKIPDSFFEKELEVIEIEGVNYV